MVRTILVPLDGSRFAEQALPTASAMARRTGARVWLVRVHVPVPLEAVPGGEALVDAEIHRAESAYLDEQVRKLDSQGVRPEAVVLRGATPFALRVAARSWPDAIVVMASHRRPRLERLLYGSVAEHLVRRSGVPVLLVGDPNANGGGVDRVIVALDGSADAEMAVAPAFDVAGPVDYVIFHVDVDRRDLAMAPQPPRADARTQVEASVKRVRGFLESRGVSASVQVMHARRPATAIVELARAGDMIAMTRSQSRLGRLLFGSTTDEVSRAAPDVALLLCQGRARPAVPRPARHFPVPRRAAPSGAHRWNPGAPRPERRPAARSGRWSVEGSGAP